jgi:hypothetical protein
LWMSVVDVNDLMGLLTKSAVMVAHWPPLWRSMKESRSCSTMLWRYCQRADIEGQLPTMWPLLVN